jgi:hypothetical protein
MKYEWFLGQDCHELRKIHTRQWINDIVVLFHGQLDQTDFFEVMVQTVGFRVQSDLPGTIQPGDQLFQNRIIININV